MEARMIDVSREKIIDVEGVAKMFNVAEVTVYSWFRRGLEKKRMGGGRRGKIFTSLEALDRFSQRSEATDDGKGDNVGASEVLAGVGASSGGLGGPINRGSVREVAEAATKRLKRKGVRAK